MNPRFTEQDLQTVDPTHWSLKVPVAVGVWPEQANAIVYLLKSGDLYRVSRLGAEFLAGLVAVCEPQEKCAFPLSSAELRQFQQLGFIEPKTVIELAN